MSPNSKKIQITISTTAGDLEDEFSTNQPLHALKREVMGRMKLDPSQAEDFILVQDGEPLEEAETLGQLGIASGSVLTLERKEVVKI